MTPNYIRCKKVPVFAFLVIFLVITVSCAGGKNRVTKQSILKGKYAIDVVKKSRNDYDLYEMKFQHPYDFTAKEIFSKLISLRYEVFTIGGKNKKIFDKKLARHLTPYFVKAFKKAKKKDIIRFDIHSPRGSIIGNMFIYRGKLNLRFETINSIPFENEDADTTSENWTLMLRKREKYHKISKLFGKVALENWIISPLKAVSVKASDVKGLKPGENTDKIQAKFTNLKFLLDKGIISKKEYNIKKKELMEKYF